MRSRLAPRFGEELEQLRRNKGIEEAALYGGERRWRELVAGEPPARPTFIRVLTSETEGLGIREASAVNRYLVLYGFPILTSDEIKNSKLLPPSRHLADAENIATFQSRDEMGARPPILVAHYPLFSNSKDVSSHQNHAQMIGQITHENREGRWGSRCDGATSYIEVPHRRFLWFNQFTACAWVYLERVDGRRRILEKGKSNSFWLFFHNNCLIVGFCDGRHYFNLLSATVPRPGEWHFVLGSFDGRFLRLFINGEYDGSRELPRYGVPTYNVEPLTIGWKKHGIGIDHLAGLISDVRLYDRALGFQQIGDLYDATRKLRSERR